MPRALGNGMAVVSGGFCNKLSQSGDLKKEKCILSWFWRPKVQNQGASGPILLLKTLKKSVFLLVFCLFLFAPIFASPVFTWLRYSLAVSTKELLEYLPPSSRGLLLCVSNKDTYHWI